MSFALFSLAMNEIGDRYIEEALTYQAPAKRRRMRPLLRMALAACLALLLTLGTAMAVSAELRGIVAGWVRAQYETFTHYEYRGGTEAPAEPGTGFIPHELTELPPGYTEISRICDEELGQQIMIYQNEDSGSACFVSAGTGGHAYVETEGCTIRPVDIAGAAGELYIPDDPAKDSSIVWTKGDMFFCISGGFTPEELLYYAERFQPVSEAAP